MKARKVLIKSKQSDSTKENEEQANLCNETNHEENYTFLDSKKLDEVNENKIIYKLQNNEEAFTVQLCYMLRKNSKQYPMTEVSGKIKCPFCGHQPRNIITHLESNTNCGNKIHLNLFKSSHEEFIKQRRAYQKKTYRKKAQEANPESFKLCKTKAETKSKKKALEANPESFKLNKAKAEKKSKKKALEANPEHVKQKKAEAYEIWKKTKHENIDQNARLMNFNKSVIFGPIFICSSCSRRLYENGVMKVTEKFKDSVNTKKQGFYRTCIPIEENIQIVVNGNPEKTGIYICHTCASTMKLGKLPSMSVQNGLQLTNIEEGCHLTELENNLIAQNINFQYIFSLKNLDGQQPKNK